MKTVKTYVCLLVAAALYGGCAEEVLYDGTENGDGRLRFTVQDLRPSTRGGQTRSKSDCPALDYVTTINLSTPGHPLYIHLEEGDNTDIAENHTGTRSMPQTLESVRKFLVTAETDENGTVKRFMKDVECTGDNALKLWSTPDDYFWPEGEAVFYARPLSDDPFYTNLNYEGGKIKFSHTVAKSADGNDAKAQPDYIIATKKSSKTSNNGTVELTFRHPLAGICITQDASLTEEEGGDALKIAKIELTGLYGSGTCIYDGTYGNNLQASNWTLTGDATESYVQTVDNLDKPIAERWVEVSCGNGTVKALTEPFMILPHTKAQLGNAVLKVTLNDGAKTVKEVALKDINGFEPGRIYVLNISKLDAKYPPVENLQGMAGNNTVSLNWDNPENSYAHIFQIGYYVVVTQSKDGGATRATTSSEVFFLNRWQDNTAKHTAGNGFPNGLELFPADQDGRSPAQHNISSKEKIDLFSYIEQDTELRLEAEGDGYAVINVAEGDRNKIDTRAYNNFKCDVYAIYYNTNDEEYKSYMAGTLGTDEEGNPKFPPVHRSIAATISIEPTVINDDVMFYVPEGAGTEDNLLDDDDCAARDWFKRTFGSHAHFVNKGTLKSTADELKKNSNAGNLVLWVPCGVQVTGDADIDTKRVADCNGWMQDDSENSIFKLPYDQYRNTYWQQFKDMARYRGLYNDPSDGLIKNVPDQNAYFTDADKAAIKEYYMAGGNLLLTTFSVYYIYEFGVIPNAMINPDTNEPFNWKQARPFFSLFNEIKIPSIWFVNAEFGGHNANKHPLYTGYNESNKLFKCLPDIFPECEKDLGPDVPEEDKPAYVGGARGREMYPLLSMGSKLCENNNVVWDFTDGHQECSMADIEEWGHARFLGTWGQRTDENVGVICEFYPGCTDPNDKSHYNPVNKTHGRCLAIGVGAFEFNNGTAYNESDNILNMYQSNIENMAKNAIEYLLKVHPEVTDPTECEDWTKAPK